MVGQGEQGEQGGSAGPSARSTVRDFIAGIPKVELHVHLEGAIRPDLLFDLGTRNGQDLQASTVEELTARFDYETFEDFVLLFVMSVGSLQGADDIALVTEHLARELAGQNVRYAEVITSPLVHQMHGTPVEDYIAGLNEGRRRAATLGVDLAWITDISRNFVDEGVAAVFEVIETGDLDALVAVGLGGAEKGYPPDPFAEAFARARALGLHTVAHAGETFGPPSILGALDVLGAERIGHGTRSVEDRELLRRLVDTGVPVELAPTSNVRLKVCDCYETHPMGELIEAGVVCTVNSDDPAMFGTTLVDEYQIVAAHCGLDTGDVRKLVLNAVDASFMPQPAKAALAAQIRAF